MGRSDKGGLTVLANLIFHFCKTSRVFKTFSAGSPFCRTLSDLNKRDQGIYDL